MSKAVELAKLGSSINVSSGTANTVGLDSISIKKIVITDGRGGNTEFDGGNTAYPAIELLAGNPTSTTQKYTPAIKFGSTDANFITQNPKYGAAIVAEAAQNYTNDSTGGMALSFWTSPTSPGTQTSLRERVTIEPSGQITVNNNLALAWQNSGFSYSAASATSKSGARLLKFTDNDLYIDNFDAGDIILRTSLASFNTALRIYGSNTNVEIFNSLSVSSNLNTKYYNLDTYAEAYSCRAWVYFSGQTNPATVYRSQNISSVVDTAVGYYDINFLENMPDALYCAVGSCAFSGGTSWMSVPRNGTSVSAEKISIGVVGNGAYADTSHVYLCIFR